MEWGPDVQHLVEVVQDRLYMMVVPADRHFQSTTTAFFNVDTELQYFGYYRDFGPLNLSCLYKYCCKLTALLKSNRYDRVVHYTADYYNTKANSAYLMGCFCLLYLQMTPNEVLKLFVGNRMKFRPFLDASQNNSLWTINIMDCFGGVAKACSLGFFNFSDFNVEEYDCYNMLQNGDLNWLVPRKFLAFIGPTNMQIPNYHHPQFYVKYFLMNGVNTVIRLNNATYDPIVFTTVGIQHYDLFFPDGSTPPKDVVHKFLHISERSTGAIAVHCKAGLGRTGSLIGCYIIKHYGFSAREAIAWLRVCRPGSVIAHQHGWLQQVEPWLMKQGATYRLENYGNPNQIQQHKYGVYSKLWRTHREKLVNVCKHTDILFEQDNSQNLMCVEPQKVLWDNDNNAFMIKGHLRPNSPRRGIN